MRIQHVSGWQNETEADLQLIGYLVALGRWLHSQARLSVVFAVRHCVNSYRMSLSGLSNMALSQDFFTKNMLVQNRSTTIIQLVGIGEILE